MKNDLERNSSFREFEFFGGNGPLERQPEIPDLIMVVSGNAVVKGTFTDVLTAQFFPGGINGDDPEFDISEGAIQCQFEIAGKPICFSGIDFDLFS